MAKREGDGINSAVIVLGALGVAAVFGGVMYMLSLQSAAPPGPEKLTISNVEPAPPPPDAPELSERMRNFFMKGNVEECIERHLGHDQRVEGTLALELQPNGTVSN